MLIDLTQQAPPTPHHEARAICSDQHFVGKTSLPSATTLKQGGICLIFNVLQIIYATLGFLLCHCKDTQLFLIHTFLLFFSLKTTLMTHQITRQNPFSTNP